MCRDYGKWVRWVKIMMVEKLSGTKVCKALLIKPKCLKVVSNIIACNSHPTGIYFIQLTYGGFI